jgi:hypothetical protein
MDRFSSVDNVLNRLQSLERLLMAVAGNGNGDDRRPTPSTVAMTDSVALLNVNPMSRSRSWNEAAGKRFS